MIKLFYKTWYATKVGCGLAVGGFAANFAACIGFVIMFLITGEGQFATTYLPVVGLLACCVIYAARNWRKARKDPDHGPLFLGMLIGVVLELVILAVLGTYFPELSEKSSDFFLNLLFLPVFLGAAIVLPCGGIAISIALLYKGAPDDNHPDPTDR